MKFSMKSFLSRAAACTTVLMMWSTAHAASLFMGAYPNSLVVFDSDSGRLEDRIILETGLPVSLRLSQDKKYIYVVTNTNSGIEVVDVKTRKVINSFTVNDATTKYRFNNGVPDPTGKLFYTVATKIEKLVDRYEVEKQKYTVIDLEKKAVVQSFDMAEQDESAFRGFGRGGTEVSPDGKFLYQFGDKVIILDTATFKVVDRLEMSLSALGGMEDGSFGNILETIREPGVFISTFNAADPYVHNKVFGVGRFDLASRQVTFKPIGPAPATMTGLQVAPNKKDAYVVATNGTLGNKRCEFWHFNLETNEINNRREFDCKSRFSFGISGDGDKLYIYGASFDLEVYDADTLELEETWDLENDVTGAGMVVIN